MVIGMMLCAATMPFIMVRMTRAPLDLPEKMHEVIAINGDYPGSCDACWFADGAGAPKDVFSHQFDLWNRFRPDCEKARIGIDFQQGVTLGHGSIDDPAGGADNRTHHLFSEAAWCVDRWGARHRMFCPRAPEVLAYEEEWIATLCSTLMPRAVWLDDDLRLGYAKSASCFCTRCIAAFNTEYGHAFGREELGKRLFESDGRDLVRREWIDFVGKSLALYGAAARKGADRTRLETIIAYQSINSSTLKTGGDNIRLLRALSGNGRHPTAIRIGSEGYEENKTKKARL